MDNSAFLVIFVLCLLLSIAESSLQLLVRNHLRRWDILGSSDDESGNEIGKGRWNAMIFFC